MFRRVEKPSVYTSVLNMSVTPAQRAEVEKLADARNISLAEAGREILARGLAVGRLYQ